MPSWETVGLVVLGIAAATAVVYGLRWAGVLREVTRGLEALGKGLAVRPIHSGAVGLVGRLARAFNTEAPQLEERLARLEQDRAQLRAVLSGMAEAVIAVDPRRRLLFANSSANRLFGLDASSVGRLMVELIRSPQVQQAVDAALAGPAAYRGEIALTGRDALGPPRVLDVLGTRLLGSPPAGAVLVFHDVTELRRLERMRQDFVANVSHELKTPLASIKAYAETLREGGLHDDRVNVRFLRQIEDQVDRLDKLVLDLLSLARLESGQEVYQHHPVAIVPVLEASVEAHRERAQAKRLNYQLNLGELNGSTQVRADEEALRQILDNLIDNALKYTPDGGGVRISCRLAADQVELEVADTGIGIPRDDLPRVFERFYRVDKARSRELGGTGLGLAIVKHLVQSLGGHVGVASRVGAGSQFTVTLPGVGLQSSDA
ncbi:MAG TPA: ATP-binding protein [Isosphaeraceae bacterium]|jgi:two-component system phosphate regulon sensor histidine kinase PhoR|nr:ATP-binding protein [Isosphaeraceae bacterium]